MAACQWNIGDPLCCDSWAATPLAVQEAAKDYATLILWAATGRQYGLCPITVRPCAPSKCGELSWIYGGWWGSGSVWNPYILNGQWFNCMCAGVCCCEPRCEVRLMGPVHSILAVMIDGVLIPSTSYRVDDDHWLVRIDGECWPECPDMNGPVGSGFEVTYVRGEPVPATLLQAASTLACEWAKACMGADCRLSNRVTSLARNGISIEMADPNDLMDSGMTGLWEVDAVIKALNPGGLVQRGRIYSPELRAPRMTTIA